MVYFLCDSKTIYEYYYCCIRLERQKNIFFQVWEDTVGRKKCFFSGLGGYRRTPPTSSCPLEHASTRFCSSPSSKLLDLTHHRAGWPWTESLSRSSVERLSSRRAEIKQWCTSRFHSHTTRIAGISQEQYCNRGGLRFVTQQNFL